MTTRLSVEDVVLPAASLGPENPLPPLAGLQEVHLVENVADLPSDMRDRVRYGRLASVLPCLDQDGYDRRLAEQPIPACVLENEHLRATVLPGLGGRLYSLVADGTELLYRNPVFQPANLGLRNAWFAGGVEWNLGSTGHWTGTCSPMHAARVDGPDGSPVLRLWEWERSRGLVVQLDFWLPPASKFLYAGVRIRNPHGHEVPAYWWSNIAVPQSPSTRVLVPADRAWHFGYGGRLELVGVPAYEGVDLTYPMRHQRAADFFFDIPAGQRPWIAAVDEAGNGLAQLSTDRLRGRKLFVWGENRGGRRWQDWLAPGAAGDGYTEIQAGLAPTQLEHLRLPADTTWDWLEAYGPVEAAAAHDPDWARAYAGVDDVLKSLLPATEFEERHRAWQSVAEAEPVERLFSGSGWGALEQARTPRASPGTPFGEETMTARERAWLPLLDGKLPATDPAEPPDGTLVAEPWRELLEAAEENWLVWYHRGVARWCAGNAAAGTFAWIRSVEAAESPWALRNLAVAAVSRGEPAEAGSYYTRSLRLAPDSRPLAVEALEAMLAADRVDDAAALLAKLPSTAREHGRVKVAEGRILLALGNPTAAEALLDAGIELADIREGANQLTDLWLAVQRALGTDRPLPDHYDFSMTGD